VCRDLSTSSVEHRKRKTLRLSTFSCIVVISARICISKTAGLGQESVLSVAKMYTLYGCLLQDETLVSVQIKVLLIESPCGAILYQ
jgi:hypothetical protein